MDVPEQQLQAVDHDPGRANFAIVGIGASAGGLAALKTFFQHVPADSGLTYVVVVHLSDEHESHLADLLQPHTKVPVRQVTETTQIELDVVYVIPPGRNLNAVDTHLHLSSIEARRRDRAPIDHFFRTLAHTYDGVSIGVILSGTGSDGTLGIKEIKQVGGLAIAQEPKEADYDGMPRSAIATGLVDLILPVAQMPAALLSYVRTQPSIAVHEEGQDLDDNERQLLHRLFAQIRVRTGRDFSGYKRSTIARRIQRRMQLHQIEQLADYVNFVRTQPDEARALGDDFLVTVTSFFRDPEVFHALETQVIPQLFDHKQFEDTLRVWSVGCATGEEAYSLAILLFEEASRRDQAPQIQVFASDLHERSLRSAREGLYAGNIDTDVSPDRLARFFSKHSGGYRVRQEIRDLVIFAPHNLLADPPFSKIDLLSCRNLLIYLQREVQGDVAELFHYALRPEGVLLLGTSESLMRGGLFQVEDKKLGLYRKRNVPSSEPRLPVFAMTGTRERVSALNQRQPAKEPPPSYALLHAQMISSHAPPSVLINQEYNVLHISADAGRFLRVPGGDPTTNVFKLVREEFRLELRAALLAAEKDRRVARSQPVEFELDGERGVVVLVIWPAEPPQYEGLMMVVFEQRAEPAREREAERADERDVGNRDLQTELELTKQRLQALIEKYETSQQEMKAANEELQATNEELRSTMEELETSKEELQSMNEELTTVNQENRHKVEEFGQLSSDLQNLMASTDIATLFLDRDLRILRFTPRVGELFNVRSTDRGRPLTDLTHRLGYDLFAEDARRVLDRLTPIEHEVQDHDGRWYLSRILPYRAAHDRIGGVVITLIEITERKKAEQALRQTAEANAFRVALSDAVRTLTNPREVKSTAVWLLGKQVHADRVLYIEMLDRSGEVQVAFGMPLTDHAYGFEDHGQALMNELRAGRTVVVHSVEADPRLHDHERTQARERGIGAFVSVPVLMGPELVRVLVVQQAQARAWSAETVALIEETVERMWTASERVKAIAALRESEERYRAIVEQSIVGVAFGDFDGRLTFVNARCAEMLGGEVEALIGRRWIEFTHPDDRERILELFERLATTGEPFAIEKRFVREQGDVVWVTNTVAAIRDAEGKPLATVALLVDITERKLAEQAVSEADRRKDEFLATLAHELRNPLAPIASALAMLREPGDSKRVNELHAIVDRQVKHMIRLVEDLLDVSRITRGAIELRKQFTDLAKVVRDAIETSRPQIDGQRRLSVEIAPDPVIVYGDHARLVQVVSNLLNNAGKYTPDRGRIWLQLTRDGERARLSVRDDGAGIAEPMLSKVFEMFVQGDKSLNSGLGVGLTLVRSLVEMHGGTVEARSAGLGQGSEFIVTLPLDVRANEPRPDEGQSAPKPVNYACRAMIVDDNRDAADTLAMLLEGYGAEVQVAYDGTTALALVQRWNPTLMFLDLGMPDMSGYELARTIRALPGGHGITLVAVTGWGHAAVGRSAAEAGFDRHVLKPASAETITKLLAEHCKRP
ncbi:MAG TPA: chemotaxis protein CheB [Enhygromyxa sp.]|nr:chemotaxis protein CheB [Enhygromyxa sp.]